MDTSMDPPQPEPLPEAPPSTIPATQSQTQSRKRKRASASAASPAPLDSGINGIAAPEVLSSRADLSSRPRLSISRGPTFLPSAEGSEFFKTELTGVNRIGYRYTPAGINPPGHFLPCRTIESNPTSYRISWEDRSSFVQVTKDGLGLSGSTGFRSARCNAPIREGRWYMEVKVIRGGGEHPHEDGKHEGSHVRLGWGRREAPLNGPVGLDGYSYGYRDKTGDKMTLSRPRPYGRPYFSGDVIGMYISLPAKRQANPKDPHDPARIKRERIAIDLKGQEVFEILEYPQSKEMAALMDYSGKTSTSASIPSSSKKITSGKLPERGPSNAPKTNVANLRALPTLPDSHIAFFVNGECQGIAFQDLYDYLQLRPSDTSRKGKDRKRTREGVKEHTENPFDDGTLGYYPPHFPLPPPSDIEALLFETHESQQQSWRPICERYAEFMSEQWALDSVEEEEAAAEAVHSAALEKAQAEKKAQRNKKRQQTEARKRVKIASETADDGIHAIPGTTSGAGQPSPLRHGTAYIAEAADLEGAPSFAPYTAGSSNPSPLRNRMGSVESDACAQSAVDRSLTPPTITPKPISPLQQTAPYAYGFPAGYQSLDARSSAALVGPGQASEAWYNPLTYPSANPPTSTAEEPRLGLLSGPGYHAYKPRDVTHESSPFHRLEPRNT